MTNNKIRKSSRSRFTVFTAVLLAFLIVYVISLFVPLLWALMTSFKAQSDFRLNIIGLPKEWVWNYSFVFDMFKVDVTTPEGRKIVHMRWVVLFSIP